MIQIIMPVFNEGDGILESIRTVHRLVGDAGICHGFLLVDDGSRDDTWDKLCLLAAELPNLTLLRFSRNFGKELALCAALEHADADAVIVMDADLQHPPAMIPEMVRLWRDEGYDIVDGVKENRGREGLVYRLCAGSYYRLFSRATGGRADQLSDFKLMNRRAVEAWRKLPERDPYFRGMSAWIGFRRCSVPFSVAPRLAGESKWSLRALIRLAVSSVTSYTTGPLLMPFLPGGLSLLACLILAIRALVRVMLGKAVTAAAGLTLLLLLLGGSILIAQGVLGVYLAKNYEEAKGRPRYLIAEVLRSAREEEPHA
ncbi:MAG: glycosyltransferase family 2 protein [Oscillospiraceae bacterium]|nr:glycosyltransferase family 2 protein [Oscillospiraceae bacterium]